MLSTLAPTIELKVFWCLVDENTAEGLWRDVGIELETHIDATGAMMELWLLQRAG